MRTTARGRPRRQNSRSKRRTRRNWTRRSGEPPTRKRRTRTSTSIALTACGKTSIPQTTTA
eukprot:4211818-Pleurochrysis_carterae.AAC.1